MKINYYVNYNGTLFVYCNNYLLFQIDECKNMNDNELIRLINDELSTSEINFKKVVKQ